MSENSFMEISDYSLIGIMVFAALDHYKNDINKTRQIQRIAYEFDYSKIDAKTAFKKLEQYTKDIEWLWNTK